MSTWRSRAALSGLHVVAMFIGTTLAAAQSLPTACPTHWVIEETYTIGWLYYGSYKTSPITPGLGYFVPDYPPDMHSGKLFFGDVVTDDRKAIAKNLYMNVNCDKRYEPTEFGPAWVVYIHDNGLIVKDVVPNSSGGPGPGTPREEVDPMSDDGTGTSLYCLWTDYYSSDGQLIDSVKEWCWIAPSSTY